MSKTNSSDDFYIYAHRRASTGAIFYIGKGQGRRAWVKNRRSKKWTAIARKHGVIVEILQAGMQEWWAFEMERDLISLHGREILANLTDCGEGVSGMRFSENAIEAMRARAADQFKCDEFRKRHQDAVKAAMQTQTVKANLIAATIAGMASPDVRKKMRDSHIGRKLSDEHKKTLSATRKGKPKSDAHKLALSISAKERRQRPSRNALESAINVITGKPLGDEHKMAISNSMREKWKDPNHKLKVSESMKATIKRKKAGIQ